jgi:3,4-dihydroxy-2-butanone 4-phosphate synthase
MRRVSQTQRPTGVAAALVELAAGSMVVLRDPAGRGGEGDLLLAAEHAGAAEVNFMAKEARGLICLALAAERADELGLTPIPSRGNSSLGDAPMISIEAAEGITTGISAADRARTIAVAADPGSGAADLVAPGHVFPLRAQPGGVLEREGRIEAAVDLATAAGLRPAAALCQILREDGRAASGEDLDQFAAHHGLTVVDVEQVVAHRRAVPSGPNAPIKNSSHRAVPYDGHAVKKNSSTTPLRPVPDVGRQMRDVMGHFATGVTVVTSRTPEGQPVGTTANAISSVSLEPPLLLACLAEGSETLAAIRATGAFAINVLAEGQREHSDRFAARGADARAHEVGFEDHPLGVPVLPGALATIACEVEAIHRAGDHEIVVGVARSLARAADLAVEPLLFYRGSYSRLTLEEDDLAA